MKKVKDILACYDVTHVYVAPTDKREVPTVKCVIVTFTAKEDKTIKATCTWNSSSINTGKLLDKLMTSDDVSGKAKLALCEGREKPNEKRENI